MRFRKGSITYWILLALEGAAEGIEIFSYSGQMRAIKQLPPNVNGESLAVAIRRLRKKGIIEQDIEDDGKRLLKLTSLGKEYLGIEEVWDGKYRIVVWDIPEKKRRIRDLFRRRLKDWNFKIWQKSIWISKRNVTAKLRVLISELELGNWVAVIESDDPFLSDIKLHDRGR